MSWSNISKSKYLHISSRIQISRCSQINLNKIDIGKLLMFRYSFRTAFDALTSKWCVNSGFHMNGVMLNSRDRVLCSLKLKGIKAKGNKCKAHSCSSTVCFIGLISSGVKQLLTIFLVNTHFSG